SHREGKPCQDYAVNPLHNELREVAVKKTTYTIGTIELHHLFTNHAVPSRAVFAGREDTDRQHAPKTINTVNRDGAHRIIDFARLEEENTEDNKKPSDKTNNCSANWIDKRAGRSDSHQASEHTVTHHGGVWLQAFH